MTIVYPILLVATLTGAGGSPAPHTAASLASMPRMTLSDAVAAAARRESPTLERRESPASSRFGIQNARRRPVRHPAMTRATAIVAGAIMGSLAGLLGGGAIDMATGNGECLPGMRIGMPVGAALGAVFTARLVR